MDIDVVGHGPASALAAVAFASKGARTRYYRVVRSPSLRPLLLKGSVVASLRALFGPLRLPLEALLESPEVEGWRASEGLVYRFRFDGVFSEPDRYVSRTDFDALVREASRRLGIEVRECPAIPAFDKAPLGRVARIVERERVPSRTAAKLQATEIFFERGVRPDLEGVAEYGSFEGALACLEAAGRTGSVLTLLGPTRSTVDRALATLENPSGGGPRNWRVLFLANPSPRRRDVEITAGDHGLPLVGDHEDIPLGDSFPSLGYASNLDASEGLTQALGLADSVLTPEFDAVEWAAAEARRLDGIRRKAAFWEKLLASDARRDDVMAAVSLVPKFLRVRLGAPL